MSNENQEYDSRKILVIRATLDLFVGLLTAERVLDTTNSIYFSIAFGLIASLIEESVVNPVLWKIAKIISG